jgi:hypothetical protein
MHSLKVTPIFLIVEDLSAADWGLDDSVRLEELTIDGGGCSGIHRGE